MESDVKIMFPESDYFAGSLSDPVADSRVDPAVDRISDPLKALGILCGMAELAMNAEGYCCLMLDHHQVVHLARRPESERITLSVSLMGPAESGRLARGPMQTWRAMHATGIYLKVLADDSLCAQFIFEGQGGSGEALLAAIDDLFAYADDWDEAAAAVAPPLSRVVGGGFSYAVKRRSRCA